MLGRIVFRAGRSILRRAGVCYRFSDLQDPRKGGREPSQPRTGVPPPTPISAPRGEEILESKQDIQDKQEQTRDTGNTAYILGGSAVLMILTYVLLQMQILRGDKKSNKFQSGKVEAVGKADIGGDWKLIDTKGKVVTSEDFLGQYYLIYFGFCNCPDICPNSLTKLKRALDIVRKLPDSNTFKLRSIFVSVDPDRDTPDKIDKFLSYFDKEMIGLTASSNNDPLLKDCLKKFKIYATKINFEDEEQHRGMQGYTIDHTILTYLIDDENNYMTHLGANLGQHDLAKTIMEKIRDNERKKLQKYRA